MPDFYWPIRWAKAKGGRVYHAGEYTGQPPMGLHAALCGYVPVQWKTITESSDEPHDILCDVCRSHQEDRSRRITAAQAREDGA